jgi:hypothetical protein
MENIEKRRAKICKKTRRYIEEIDKKSQDIEKA